MRKNTLKRNKVVYEISVIFSSLMGDVLKMITDFKFDGTDLVDAKLNANNIKDMRFDTRTRGERVRDRYT